MFVYLVLFIAWNLWFVIWNSPTITFAADKEAGVIEGLRDVRGPISYPVNYLAFIIFFLVGIAGLIIFLYLRRKPKKRTEELPVDTRLPWEIAYDQLDQLARSPYLEEGRFKEYYSELSGIIRYYFESRFTIRAPEMTTEEFLWSLEKSKDLQTSHKETLKKFMTSCDIIKFAKHIPRVEEAEESFRFARQLVDETKIAEAGPPSDSKG